MKNSEIHFAVRFFHVSFVPAGTNAKKGTVINMKRTFKVKINNTEYIAEVEEIPTDDGKTEDRGENGSGKDTQNGEKDNSRRTDKL